MRDFRFPASDAEIGQFNFFLGLKLFLLICTLGLVSLLHLYVCLVRLVSLVSTSLTLLGTRSVVDCSTDLLISIHWYIKCFLRRQSCLSILLNCAFWDFTVSVVPREASVAPDPVLTIHFSVICCTEVHLGAVIASLVLLVAVVAILTEGYHTLIR